MRQFRSDDATEVFCQAVDALDGALGLSGAGVGAGGGGGARRLVVVSDGHYTAAQRADGQARVRRLLATGCGVLWIALRADPKPLDGVQVVLLDDPSAVGAVIATAAQRALGGARHDQATATSTQQEATPMDPPEHPDSLGDGTGAGLLGFCAWLGRPGPRDDEGDPEPSCGRGKPDCRRDVLGGLIHKYEYTA